MVVCGLSVGAQDAVYPAGAGQVLPESGQHSEVTHAAEPEKVHYHQGQNQNYIEPHCHEGERLAAEKNTGASDVPISSNIYT